VAIQDDVNSLAGIHPQMESTMDQALQHRIVVDLKQYGECF